VRAHERDACVRVSPQATAPSGLLAVGTRGGGLGRLGSGLDGNLTRELYR
jgi:hypothetical protein